MVLGWNERRNRSCAGAGGGGLRPRDGSRDRQVNGGLSPSGRWTVAALDVAGSGCNVRSRAERTYLCQKESEQAAIDGGTCCCRFSEPEAIQSAVQKRNWTTPR